MWCYRRMEKINWINRVTNEEDLERVSVKNDPDHCNIGSMKTLRYWI